MGLVVENDDLSFRFDVYGYKIGNDIIDIDDSLTNISNILGDLQFKMNNTMWLCRKEKLVKEARLFLENYFSLREVMYLPERIISNIRLCTFLDIFDTNDVIRDAKDRITLIKPYDIPIKYSSDSMVCSSFVDNSICFYEIDLEKKNSKNIIPEYIHELIHTQLMCCKGIITDFHNREVLSIFLEYLSALMLDSKRKLFHNVSIVRNFNLFNCIGYLDYGIDLGSKLEASIYIVSTLKANKLFDIFVTSNDDVKKEIINGVQSVFDGNICLEDFLEKFDISYDNSKDLNILNRQLNMCKKRKL